MLLVGTNLNHFRILGKISICVHFNLVNRMSEVNSIGISSGEQEA